MSWQLYRKNVQQIIQSLIRKLASLSQYEEVLAKINATSTDRLTVLKTKPQSIQRDIITVCNDPYMLAQQLTHIELVSCCQVIHICIFPTTILFFLLFASAKEMIAWFNFFFKCRRGSITLDQKSLSRRLYKRILWTMTR